jgi:hypothetical protein
VHDLPNATVPVEATEMTIALLAGWFSAHLQALDELGGTPRLPRFSANLPAALAAMERPNIRLRLSQQNGSA